MNIQDIRQQYPQYENVSDQQLAEGLHSKFYADMDFDDFSSRIGYQQQPFETGDSEPTEFDEGEFDPLLEELTPEQEAAPSFESTFKALPAVTGHAIMQGIGGLQQFFAAGKLRASDPTQGEEGEFDPLLEFEEGDEPDQPTTAAEFQAELNANPEARKLFDQGKAIGDFARSEIKRITPKGQTFWQKAITTAGQSVGIALPGLAVSVLARNPAPMIGSFSAFTLGQSFDEAIEAGVGPDAAVRHSITSAILEGGTEFLPAVVLIKKGTPVFKRLVNFLLTEVPGENVAEVGQLLSEEINGLREDVTAKDIIDTIKLTTAATLLGAGVQVTAANYLDKAFNKIDSNRELSAAAGNADLGDPEVQALMGMRPDPGVIEEEAKPAVEPEAVVEEEKPAPAEEAVTQEEIEAQAAEEQAALEEPAPASLAEHQDVVETMLGSDFIEGGGVSLVPDPDFVRGESDKPGEVPLVRTKSQNPEYVQAILAETGLSVKKVKQAVKKAIAGDKLGKRQQQAVDMMLDKITGRIAEDKKFTEAERLQRQDEQQEELFGEKDETVQAIHDRRVELERKQREAPEAGVDGGLFSDQQKQADIEDVKKAPKEKPLPKTASIGPGTVTVKPVGKTGKSLYRETSPEGLQSILLTNRGGGVETVFVTDDETLSIGQKGNVGVSIVFRADRVSGDEHRKPGAGIIGGKEYKTNYIGQNAISKITVRPETPIRKRLIRDLLEQKFDKSVDASGVTTYTPKIKPETQEITEARKKVQKKIEEGKEDAGETEPEVRLLGGIPVDMMSDEIKRTFDQVRDAAGIPLKKAPGAVEVQRPEKSGEPGLLTQLVSPSTIAKNYPAFKPYFEAAQRAHETQEKLRLGFTKRLNKIHGMLSKEEQALLDEIRLTEDMLGEDFTPEVLKDTFGASDNVATAHRLMRSAYDKALNMANTVRELRNKPRINRRTGYVPHFFHRWLVIVDGDIKVSAQTLREAISISNKKARKGADVKIVPLDYKFEGESNHAAIVGDKQYFKIQKNIQDQFEMTPEEAQEIVGDIVRRKGRSRFMGSFLERKGVEGFSTNMGWVDRHYFNMVARFVALDKFKQKTYNKFEQQYGPIDKEYRKGLAKYTKEFINDVNGVPTATEELLNQVIKDSPISKFMGTYLGDRPVLQMAGMITNAVAIAKLGLYNVSSALVNGTQLLNANALLGTKAMAIGIKRAAAVDLAVAKRKFGMTTETKEDIGVLKKAGVDIQLGLESGAGYSKAAQTGRIFNATTLFFRGVERGLRQSTTLAAYHKALGEGKSRTEAIKFAQEINNRVNFDYSIVDAPGFIRKFGPIGQVLFQFKKFPVKQMEFIVSLKGAEHAKFWTPMLILGGYYSLPGMAALMNLINGLFDIDAEDEIKKYLFNWAGDDPERGRVAEVVLYGLLSQPELGGVDVSRRVGGGDFIPSRMSDLLGPGLSSVSRGVPLFFSGDHIEALRAFATAPGNIAVAFANEEDILDPYDRSRKIVERTPGYRAKKSMGFRQIEEVKAADIKKIARNEAQKLAKAKREIVDDIIIGSIEKDRDRVRKATQRARDEGIGITTESINNEIKLKKLSKAQRAILNASPEVLKKIQGAVKFIQKNQKPKK